MIVSWSKDSNVTWRGDGEARVTKRRTRQGQPRPSIPRSAFSKSGAWRKEKNVGAGNETSSAHKTKLRVQQEKRNDIQTHGRKKLGKSPDRRKSGRIKGGAPVSNSLTKTPQERTEIKHGGQRGKRKRRKTTNERFLHRGGGEKSSFCRAKALSWRIYRRRKGFERASPGAPSSGEENGNTHRGCRGRYYKTEAMRKRENGTEINTIKYHQEKVFEWNTEQEGLQGEPTYDRRVMMGEEG